MLPPFAQRAFWQVLNGLTSVQLLIGWSTSTLFSLGWLEVSIEHASNMGAYRVINVFSFGNVVINVFSFSLYEFRAFWKWLEIYRFITFYNFRLRSFLDFRSLLEL
jgi:hypothetical protein